MTHACQHCPLLPDGSYACYWAQSYHCDCDHCHHSDQPARDYVQHGHQ